MSKGRHPRRRTVLRFAAHFAGSLHCIQRVFEPVSCMRLKQPLSFSGIPFQSRIKHFSVLFDRNLAAVGQNKHF